MGLPSPDKEKHRKSFRTAGRGGGANYYDDDYCYYYYYYY